jgi:heavy metal translocating P-type ATPase
MMRFERRAIGEMARAALLPATLAGLAIGVVLRFLGRGDFANAVWGGTILVALAPLAFSTARALRRGALGVDLIALLAMACALLLGENLAGAVIALMLSGGQALETYAGARARRDLSALARAAPRVAHRSDAGGFATIAVEAVSAGDSLLVKAGEVIPVDGVVDDEAAVLDEATLSGEARPVERVRGDPVLSGALNAGSAFRMRATRTAADSTYTHIVRLVEAAQTSKAPLVRLADRYALGFLSLTLLSAALAWALSGDPRRALAVLVVATPCPLILAAPIAIISGISRAARRGLVIKGGAALETLARARILFLDKTGTLTTGRPVVWDVETLTTIDADEVIRLAASLDQVSPHVLASAIVRMARERGLTLSVPSDVVEEPGTGIRGVVDGRLVAVGKRSWVEPGIPESTRARRIRHRASLEGSTNVFVSIDGSLAAVILIEDPIRADAARTVRKLRKAGFVEVVMLTGDRADLAETVGAAIGADAVLAERLPIDKADAVRAARGRGATVMVGDGINDAPALAAADVGVALGARGATVSSEASDVVLIVDRLDPLADAVTIARRSRRIALESILAGIALSLVAMGFAAAGALAPVAGALVQEAIDVAVILNALRALGGARAHATDAHAAALGTRFRREHRELLPDVDRIRYVADRLDELPPQAQREALEEVRRFLLERLVPHEREEDARMYPVVAKVLGGEDPTGTMTRAHIEIAHLSRLFVRQLDAMADDGPSTEDLRDLRRILYGLYAILRLHFAQEEEAYLSYVEERLGTHEHAASTA